MSIAGFELGQLYEHGVSGSVEEARAWKWYGDAAAAGDPNALARFAERSSSAAREEPDASKRRADLLLAFKYYAAAAERARHEDWPDDLWMTWRYRRATLARVLDREGMMQQVADVYNEVRDQYARRPRTLRERLVSLFRPWLRP